MRIAGLVLLFCFLLAAESHDPESALVRGVVLERDPQPAGGEFSIRLDDSQVFRYRFDDRTFVDRDNYPISVPRLRPGEKIEVLSDRLPGSVLRYARTVHVIVPPLAEVPQPRRRTVATSSENLLWHPSLSLFGVVGRLTQSRLLLHTREGDRTVLLLPDTRYFENGEIVPAASLLPNMRVFIQGGKNLEDQVEGYRVIWGRILSPANW